MSLRHSYCSVAAIAQGKRANDCASDDALISFSQEQDAVTNKIAVFDGKHAQRSSTEVFPHLALIADAFLWDR